MAQLTVPIAFDHDDLQRMVNEKIAEVKAQFIPKDQYEARLRADMAAMLEDLDLQIDEFDSGCGWDGYIQKIDVHKLIQQKINVLKAESEDI